MTARPPGSARWHSATGQRRLSAVWLASTTSRASVVLPSLTAAHLAVGSPEVARVGIVAFSLVLFAANVATFASEADVLVRSDAPRAGGSSAGAYLAGAALAAGLWLRLSPAALVILAVVGFVQAPIATARARLLLRGEILRPHCTTLARDLPLTVGWLALAHLVNRPSGTGVVAVLLAASIVQLGVLWPNSGTNKRLVTSRLKVPSLALSFALHASLPTLARLLLARTSSIGVLVAFEIADRWTYLVVSALVGSIPTELQRRWASADRDVRREAIFLGDVVFILGAIVGMSVAAIALVSGVPGDTVTASEWLASAVLLGIESGGYGAATITVRWEMAHGFGERVAKRLFVLGVTGLVLLGIASGAGGIVAVSAVLCAHAGAVALRTRWLITKEPEC